MTYVQIALEQNVTPEIREQVIGGLVAFNTDRSGDARHTEVAVIGRRAGEIVGGLFGYTNWEWLFIAQLWVAETIRGEGIGQQLLTIAETEAARRGCRHAHVDTFSFQARPFYERMGYIVFGQLEDYPAGQTRYFLQKRGLVARP